MHEASRGLTLGFRLQASGFSPLINPAKAIPQQLPLKPDDSREES